MGMSWYVNTRHDAPHHQNWIGEHSGEHPIETVLFVRCFDPQPVIGTPVLQTQIIHLMDLLFDETIHKE